MPDNTDFLGRGWSFPPTFRKQTRSVDMLTGEDDIRSSLEILLSTRLGERVMQSGYGTNLDNLVFEAVTTTMLTTMRDQIRRAIIFYEPRINLQRVEILTDRQAEGLLFIVIDYIVRSTNTRNNLVFPFYLNEATEVPNP